MTTTNQIASQLGVAANDVIYARPTGAGLYPWQAVEVVFVGSRYYGYIDRDGQFIYDRKVNR